MLKEELKEYYASKYQRGTKFSDENDSVQFRRTREVAVGRDQSRIRKELKKTTTSFVLEDNGTIA